MKNSLNKKVVLAFRIVIDIALILIAVYLFLDMRNTSIETILKSPSLLTIISALFVLFLYAIKSVTVFIPLVALQLYTGSLFEQYPALLLNFLGILICYTIPYYIGKRTGHKENSKFLDKFPKLEKFISHKEQGVFIPSIILRLIGFLPADLVSAYLGTMSGSYFKYITGSLLGSVIRIIAITVLGANLNNIHSPQFVISVIIIVLLSILSCLGYVFYQRKSEE